MRSLRTSLILLVMLVTAASARAAAVELLAPGEALGDATMVGRSRWLGLYVDGRVFELRSVDVEIEAFDGDVAGGSVAVGVTVPDSPVPLLLLRGGSIAAGSVPTAFAGLAAIPRGGSISLDLDGESSTLLVEAAKGLAEDDVPARMVLIRGREEQVIAVADDSDEIYPAFGVYLDGLLPRLVWAGDLDGDRRLDLVLEAITSEGNRILSLYLSSEARGGELVRVGARAELFAPSGC